MTSLLHLDPETALPPVASRRWRRDFELRQGRHGDRRATQRPELPADVEAALRPSLAVFQLGETGEGTHLLAMAAATGDRDYLEAMRLFVAEEREHADMLASVLHQFEEPLLERHWSDRAFQLIRRVSGLRAEVLTLLVAELIALRYYSALVQGLGTQHELRRVFEAIHADEVRHVDFHADTLPVYLEQWSRPMWWCGRIVWNVVLYGSAVLAAWDHRNIMRRCGVGVVRFLRDCHHTFRRHEPRFFRRR